MDEITLHSTPYWTKTRGASPPMLLLRRVQRQGINALADMVKPM